MLYISQYKSIASATEQIVIFNNIMTCFYTVNKIKFSTFHAVLSSKFLAVIR